MKIKTRGKGEWHIVELTPEKVMEMASTVALQISKGQKIDSYYWNITQDDQFRIEVRK
jgi:hypothetical protein